MADFSVTDVTVEEQVVAALQQAVTRFGGLDILLSNAGISGDIAPITDYPAEVFRRRPETCTCSAHTSCSSTVSRGCGTAAA